MGFNTPPLGAKLSPYAVDSRNEPDPAVRSYQTDHSGSATTCRTGQRDRFCGSSLDYGPLAYPQSKKRSQQRLNPPYSHHPIGRRQHHVRFQVCSLLPGAAYIIGKFPTAHRPAMRTYLLMAFIDRRFHRYLRYFMRISGLDFPPFYPFRNVSFPSVTSYTSESFF